MAGYSNWVATGFHLILVAFLFYDNTINSMAITLPSPIERNIFFSCQVDQSTIRGVSERIVSINADDETIKKVYAAYGLDYTPAPITIYIDSYGGAVYQCFGLLSIMESSKVPIYTYATGAAMSCGFMMFISGHRRFIYKNATVMCHQVSGGGHGSLKTLEDDVKEYKRVQKIIDRIIVQKTKISKKRLKEVFNQKLDWFINAEEALKLGVADEII